MKTLLSRTCFWFWFFSYLFWLSSISVCFQSYPCTLHFPWWLILLFSKCRSLFVPYFKYLLDSCIRHLTGAEDANVAVPRKKKKAKHQEGYSNVDVENGTVMHQVWHLRTLVLSSLHRCFLYDTGNLKFLDSSNFQVSQNTLFTFYAFEFAVVNLAIFSM